MRRCAVHEWPGVMNELGRFEPRYLGGYDLKMVRAAGVEPTTFGFGGRHSIQLSYARNLLKNRQCNLASSTTRLTRTLSHGGHRRRQDAKWAHGRIYRDILCPVHAGGKANPLFAGRAGLALARAKSIRSKPVVKMGGQQAANQPTAIHSLSAAQPQGTKCFPQQRPWLLAGAFPSSLQYGP